MAPYHRPLGPDLTEIDAEFSKYTRKPVEPRYYDSHFKESHSYPWEAVLHNQPFLATLQAPELHLHRNQEKQDPRWHDDVQNFRATEAASAFQHIQLSQAAHSFFSLFHLSSQPRHFLVTNDAPPQIVADQILELLLAGKAYLSSLQQESDRLAPIDYDDKPYLHAYQLDHHRSVIERMADTARSTVFSPIRRVPVEIIGEFLLHALGAHEGYLQPVDLYHPQNTVWLFMRICKLWRTVILSFPQLWSSWEFPRGTRKMISSVPNKFQAFMDLLSKRSGSYPLTIAVEEDSSIESPIMTFIISQSFRWKTIKLGLYHETQLDHLNRVQGHIPILESLHFSLNDIHPDPVMAGKVCAFQVAPSLRSVEMHCDTTVFSSFPWAQLTDYNEVARTTSLDTFRQLKNIVRCTLDKPDVTTSTAHILLPHLQYLNMQSSLQMLEYMTLPSLICLKVLKIDALENHVEALLDRSGCILDSLVIYRAFRSPIPILQLTPGLTSLALGSAPYDHHLIELLVARPGPSVFLPYLHTIQMHFKYEKHQHKNGELNQSTIIDLINSRLSQRPPTVERLKSFRLSIGHRFKTDQRVFSDETYTYLKSLEALEPEKVCIMVYERGMWGDIIE